MKAGFSYAITNNKEECYAIRKEVFMEEQGFQEEFDEFDESAIHITLYKNEKVVGCGRILPGERKDVKICGRIAITKENRQKGYGRRLLECMETVSKKEGASECHLDAQVQAKKFYEKNGYQSFGSLHEDEGVAHIWMKKHLK